MYVGCVCECVCIGYVKCEVCVGDCVLSVWSMLDGVVYVWESVCCECVCCMYGVFVRKCVLDVFV